MGRRGHPGATVGAVGRFARGRAGRTVSTPRTLGRGEHARAGGLGTPNCSASLSGTARDPAGNLRGLCRWPAP